MPQSSTPLSSTDLGELGAGELLGLYARKAASPVEATEAALDRIRRFDGAVNAWVLVDEDSARADAKASEARWMAGRPIGPVDGVPSCRQGSMIQRQKSGPRLRVSPSVRDSETL